MLKSLNVAIPSTAETVVVPASIAPLGFAASASATGVVAPGTVLPRASCTATRTAGAMGVAPSTMAGGAVTNATCVAGPTTANGLLTLEMPRCRARSV